MKMHLVEDYRKYHFIQFLGTEEERPPMCLPQLLVVFLLCFLDCWIVTLNITLNFAGQCVILIHWNQHTETHINQCEYNWKGVGSPLFLGLVSPYFWTTVGARNICSLKQMSCGVVSINGIIYEDLARSRRIGPFYYNKHCEISSYSLFI
eukprot:UN02177